MCCVVALASAGVGDSHRKPNCRADAGVTFTVNINSGVTGTYSTDCATPGHGIPAPPPNNSTKPNPAQNKQKFDAACLRSPISSLQVPEATDYRLC
jgi:hypothetical protein